LVERDIQNHAAMQILQFSVNPAFGLDPALAAEEALRAQRLDPKRFQLSPEKKAQMAQQQAPTAPQIEAAKIRAEADLKKTEMVLGQKAQEAQTEAQLMSERIRVDTDRDTVYVQAQTQRDQTQAELGLRELELKRELAMMDYANKHQLSLEQVKAKLAETAMKINAQKELSMASLEADIGKHRANVSADLHKHHTPQVATPAVEPAGRAPSGQAFSA
jgi:hypothetical protein